MTFGCREPATEVIQVVTGAGEGARVSFVPKHGLATYLELPPRKHELTITLAEEDASCDRFVPPGDGKTTVTATLVLPPGVEPSPGAFPAGRADADDGGVAAAYVVPTARVGRTSHLFQPGGALRLEKVGLNVGDRIVGVLAFSFAGDEAHAATSMDGRFVATLCRASRAPSP